MITIDRFRGGAKRAPVWIEILRGTMCQGQRLIPGDVVECPEDLARNLIAFGKAAQIPEPEKPKRAKKDK